MSYVNPTVVCHLVVVVGLIALMTWKISKIRKQGANQEHTKTSYEQLLYTLPVLMHWLVFSFNTDFDFTAIYGFIGIIYGFITIYVTFSYFNFLRMCIGRNWYGLSAGQVQPAPKVR